MSATNSIHSSLDTTDRFFIGGAWVTPSTSSKFDIINPSTEELFYRVSEAKAEDLDRAIAAAREAFDNGPWPHLSHSERALYLSRFAAALDDRSLEVSTLWSGQMGIVNSTAQVAVSNFGRAFRYYADLGASFAFEEQMSAPSAGGSAVLIREPVGVVGAIIAWNGPIFNIGNKVAPALLAGCTVILKAAPEAPGEAYVLAEVAEAIGLPAGVLNVVVADREVSELLVRDPRVDKISFTGSTAVGRRIAALCGERIARVTLELGGKSAALVLDDYDIHEAATTLTAQACMLNGQVCTSLTRIIVSRNRHDALVDAMADCFSRVQIGDAFDPASDLGPLAMSRHRDRVESYIAKGLEESATLVIGGHRPANLDRGFFIEPTIFANVDNSSVIAQEEIFGPVLSVIPAINEDDAIAIANDTIYGLNNAVFTTDAERALAVARRLRSGTASQNAKPRSREITFGGFKQSGIGREAGTEGLLSYLETKAVILDSETT
jgi:aldehyde dehydrogenase (NAD+)